jgi:acetyl-CoA acetyltransferase family protein
MAKENDISRRAQDEIALLSHQRAAAAQADGRFKEQIVPLFPAPAYDRAVLADNGVRSDSSLEALAALPPVFDRRYGTLTAGNSSPLTDGGAAVLLMSEDKARALGYQPLGYVRSFAFAALDPGTQLLQGPAYAAPLALDRAGLRLRDIELVEMHEAFAAQILARRDRSRALQRHRRLDRDRPPVRRHRGAGHPPAAARAAAPASQLRADDRVRRRRRRLRHDRGAAVAARGAGLAAELP